jgi:hypothetical protein
MISELTNHLWQSTLFAIAAGLLTVAFRKNRAQVRYWLWFSATCLCSAGHNGNYAWAPLMLC